VDAKPFANYHGLVSKAILTSGILQCPTSKLCLKFTEACAERLEKRLEYGRDFLLEKIPLNVQLTSHFPNELSIPVHGATLGGVMLALI
jgi:hypothetical protein